MAEETVEKASEEANEAIDKALDICKLLFEQIKALKNVADTLCKDNSIMTQMVGNTIGLYIQEMSIDYKNLIYFMDMITSKNVSPIDIFFKVRKDYPEKTRSALERVLGITDNDN